MRTRTRISYVSYDFCLAGGRCRHHNTTSGWAEPHHFLPLRLLLCSHGCGALHARVLAGLQAREGGGVS